MSDTLSEKLTEYADRFNENFPIFHLRHLDDGQIVKIIRKCLDDGKPYEPDYSDGSVVY